MSAWGKKPSAAIRQGPPPAMNRQASTGSAASMNSMNSMSSGMLGSNRRINPNGSSGVSNNGSRRPSHGNDSGRGGGGGWPSRSNSSGNNAGSSDNGSGRGGGGGWPSRSNSGGNNAGSSRNNAGSSGNNAGRGGNNTGNGGGGNHRNSRKTNRPKHDVLQLNLKLLQPGDGKTLSQTSVMRRTAEHLLSLRLDYLDPLEEDWDPPAHCAWSNEEERREEISKIAQASRQGGDVSQNNKRRSTVKETAPPIEDCKPLEVNSETRWKSKVFEKNTEEEKEVELSDDDILKKALLILNKLSLTKFEKLSNAFVATGIDRNKNTMEGAVNIVVDKAQSEPHFSSMYAQLCFKLSKKATVLGDVNRKIFRKLLLTRCQREFEEDQTAKIDAATKGLTDDEEIAYHTGLVKRAYLGHMRFIGELYKGDMIKLQIMLWCIKNLLEKYEEERVECFTKLMTTVGYPLEQQSTILAHTGKSEPQNQLNACWEQVKSMISGKEASNRIKFLLLDLVEMKEKGWVKRRKEETAKTLDQIHREVEMEERKAHEKSRGGHSTSGRNDRNDRSLRRSTSTSNHVYSKPPEPLVDADGFTIVMPTSRSSSNLMRASSDATGTTNTNKMRRAQSMTVMGGGMMTNNSRLQSNTNNTGNVITSNPTQRNPVRSKSMAIMDPVAAATAKETNLPQNPVDRKEVQSKVNNLLKEFLAVGDTNDSMLSLKELVDLAVEENTRNDIKKLLVESCILFVLERKKDDVEKAIKLLLAATTKESNLLNPPDFIAGLAVPLEFLSDIEIDAPKAGEYLAIILSKLCEAKLVELEPLLKGAPDYFLSDGKPAHLAIRVFLMTEEKITDSQFSLVEKFMTDRDKEDFASPKAILESLQK